MSQRGVLAKYLLRAGGLEGNVGQARVSGSAAGIRRGGETVKSSTSTDAVSRPVMFAADPFTI